MGNWEENLCGCLGAKCFCCLVMIFPVLYPAYQGWIINKATGESCLTACLGPFFLCCIGASVNRGKIRDRYLIDGSFCEDCLIHAFCCACAICQEYREVRNKERL